MPEFKDRRDNSVTNLPEDFQAPTTESAPRYKYINGVPVKNPKMPVPKGSFSALYYGSGIATPSAGTVISGPAEGTWREDFAAAKDYWQKRPHEETWPEPVVNERYKFVDGRAVKVPVDQKATQEYQNEVSRLIQKWKDRHPDKFRFE